MKTENDWQERCKDILHGGSRSFIAHHPSRISKNILAYEGIMYNVTNDSGEESYWSFSHDISERLHYEAQIKRLNLIMDTTIDNLPAGIVVKEVNNDFRYIYRNRESYNRDLCIGEAIGKNDFDYYPPEVAEKKREEDVLVATTGQGLHWTMEGKDKNGNQLILDKRKIRVDGDELSSPIIVSIEWDITELEKIKRELQTSKEKAEMSDKLKSAFLANMSHEIRTPLNAIVGFSHLIAESENTEERHTFYEIVEANNERLLQLINEILDLSKIESGIIEFTSAPVNIHSLCKEVYDAHVFRTPQGVKLIYEPSENGLVIETDKNRVFQVFSNLIGNAFKFTKAGSISYGYKLVNKQVVFHVTDTGTGIEPEKIERVFERFAKLNNYAQGTGLGLSICKTIVERLGGEISVSSVVGKGTTFTFTLPYESDQASGDREEQERNATNANGNPSDTAAMGTFAETSVQDASGSVSGNTEEGCSEGSSADASPNQQTILIAEDEDSNFDLLKAILGRKYRLIRARDGMEAVMSYDEAKPDLILMDIKMPNLDGLEATKIIRELSTTVPIIAQSAYAYQQDQIAAMDVGCNDFIAKPISQAKLKDMINKWLP
jgi:signal transduction histidine kinase/CheY-like chemotaxis protein